MLPNLLNSSNRDNEKTEFKIQDYDKRVVVSSLRLGKERVQALSALVPQRRFKIVAAWQADGLLGGDGFVL